MSRIVISGATGGVYLRMNIKDFVKSDNIKQFSLFIQALSAMQKLPWKEQLSWFALGGIHGYPYKPWGGSAVTESIETEWEGYCTHGTVLFPTWHRPYVAAVEQFIHDHAVKKAKEYIDYDSAEWKKAAESLRFPYWDWANDALPPDEVIAYETVSIITPYGKAVVSNPLYSFHFDENIEDFPGKYKKWKNTLRYPTSLESSAESDVKTLKRTLVKNAPQNRESVWRMLMFVREWENFSKHTYSENPDISLERIHDNVHLLIGGGGHMSSVPMAGFDPIFFLHHCNVDRLLSEWSALYPNVWVTPGSSEDGTRTIPAHTTIDELTDLTPFSNSTTSYWTSSSLKTTEGLGYTYTAKRSDPEDYPRAGRALQGVSNATHALFAESVTRLFAGLDEERAESAASTAASVGGGDKPGQPHNNPGNLSSSVYDWKVRVRVKEFELDESFQVLIFLGTPPEDHTQWMEHESYVGSVGVFVNEIPESCPNCAARPDKIIQGTVYLTDKIAKTRRPGGLSRFPGSLDPRAVSPHLEQELNWRVRKVMGGVPVPLSELPSLEVTVFSTYLTKEEGTIFPTLGETILHEHITRGRVGGYRDVQAAT